MLAALLPQVVVVRPAHASPGTPHVDGGYVALGDSFTAGPFIPHLYGRPVLCLRSDHDYPALVARAIGATSFTDVSCSGAKTSDMTHPQPLVSAILGQRNARQFAALTPDTRLVTVGIGGNDIGYTDLVVTCARLSVTDPTGAPCTRHYTADGEDRIGARIRATAPKILAVLRGIHRRAPQARVLVVGYPDILPRRGPGCWPMVPVARGDISYLNMVERRLNAMLAREAAAAGATFVDVSTLSAGHDVCAPPGRKWVEGIIPTSLAAPVHPNAAGMAAVARRVIAALRAAPAA